MENCNWGKMIEILKKMKEKNDIEYGTSEREGHQTSHNI